MNFFEKQKDAKVAYTHFSDFMRNASSAEKKRLFTTVLNESIEDQKRTIEKARKLSN